MNQLMRMFLAELERDRTYPKSVILWLGSIPSIAEILSYQAAVKNSRLLSPSFPSPQLWFTFAHIGMLPMVVGM
jgi:hypothetical protein